MQVFLIFLKVKLHFLCYTLTSFYFELKHIRSQPNPVQVIFWFVSTDSICSKTTCLFSVPTEVQLLKREYFNRWYGLTSFFCAYTFALMPGHILFTSLYVSVSYFLTDQPMETCRFLNYLVIMLIVGAVSESLGMVLGSIFNVVVSLCFTPYPAIYNS